MNANGSSRLKRLGDGAILRIVDQPGTTVAVLRGSIWVTQDADRRDVFLDAGESFQLDRPGLAIVQAFGAAFLQLSSEASLDNIDRRAVSEIKRYALRLRSQAIAEFVTALNGQLSRPWTSLRLAATRRRSKARSPVQVHPC